MLSYRPSSRDLGNITGDVYAVPRLHFINQVIVSIDNSCVRRLTSGHVFRRLLNFDLKKKQNKPKVNK